MRRFVIAGAVAGLLLGLLALPVAAADLSGGCQLVVRSSDANGNVVDNGTVPGAIGSQSNPFKVTWDGRVDFDFSTPVLFQNNHWSMQVEGIPVFSGSDDSPTDLDRVGNVTISTTMPVRLVGLFAVSGDIYGNNDANHCHGDGWIYIQGDPVGTIPWIAGAVLLVLGVIGLLVTPYVSLGAAASAPLPEGRPTDA
jgi:hypothetical protein